MAVDRKDRELIRKRRNNFMKRADEFHRRYGMWVCVMMETPTGRLYTYRSNPGRPVPTEKEIRERHPPAVQKTPADYNSESGVATHRDCTRSASPVVDGTSEMPAAEDQQPSEVCEEEPDGGVAGLVSPTFFKRLRLPPLRLLMFD
ncbi:hypothetical protein PISL3812_10046 [Talaromyces islandicus]|uniref:MADS-box domain-containing protein n=1 Tax=Talaromyces islandicus TaxID=28573 RepID=A0A0U1MBN8_TALIS|nr:hypothetical protein PISL3812_10046 [Talaromyces islandicus]